MDTQEYLGFISILERARTSINEALVYFSDRPYASSNLKRALLDFEEAIQAYRGKLNATHVTASPTPPTPN